MFVQGKWAGTYPPGTQMEAVGTTASLLAVDSRARLMYVAMGALTDDLQIRAFNLDTSRPVGTVLHIAKAAKTLPVPLVWSVDERHHLLFVAQPPTSTGVAVPAISVVGVRGGKLKLLATVHPNFAANTYVTGLSVDARHGQLWAMAQSTLNSGVSGALVGQSPVGFELDTWPTKSLARGSMKGGWSSPFRVGSTCGSPLTTYFPAGIVEARNGRGVYFGCSTNRTAADTYQSNVGDFTGVAGLPLSRNGAPEVGAQLSLSPTPTPNEFTTDSFGWAKGGRLTLAFDSPGHTTMTVFDVNHQRYIGNVASPGSKAIVGLTVDETTGRTFYASNSGSSHGGLGFFEQSAVPVTQGQFYPQFEQETGPDYKPSFLAVDPRTNRLFLPVAEFPHDNSGTASMLVVRDALGRFAAPRPADPDFGAFHGADKAGVSDSNRAASGGAYGAEFRIAGGTSALVTNISHFQDLQGTAQPGTRHMDFAVAGGLTLSNDSATARATTLDSDDVTNSDLNPSPPVGAQPIPPQACNSFGAKSEAHADSVDVSCDVAGARTTSDVSFAAPRVLLSDPQTHHPVSAPAPVQIRSTQVHSQQYRVGTRGALIGKITAEADGIDILGRVQIGRITATAITTAHGQRHGTSASYTRTISHVSIDGKSICASDCSARAVTDRINNALAGHGSIELPGARPSASPGGVLAQVKEDPYTHTEQTLFDDVAADSWVAPAGVITINLDSTQPSRLIVNLAAVTSSSYYRLYQLNQSQPAQPAVPAPKLPTVKVNGAAPANVDDTTPSSSTQPQLAAGPDTSTSAYLADVAHRLAFAMRSPRGIFSIACIWALLSLPVYLASRRRLLLEAPALLTTTPSSRSTDERFS